ncbi:transposase [Rosistilla carotiformis]|uniref:transposase n=1 Tax=Rosistilla carotiformis TaxID=2528017 RepID=UPI001E648437|nr:transposase [Rosistilla carotiformis]
MCWGPENSHGDTKAQSSRRGAWCEKRGETLSGLICPGIPKRSHAPKRADEANAIYHALNRGIARADLFHKEADDEAFERMLAEGLVRYSVQLLAYQLSPNHWQLVLRPTEAGRMSKFLRWVPATHTMRYHAHDHTSGERNVYHWRFRSFPVQDDDHFHVVWPRGGWRRAFRRIQLRINRLKPRLQRSCSRHSVLPSVNRNTVQRRSLGPSKALAAGRRGRGYESQRFGLMQMDS